MISGGVGVLWKKTEMRRTGRRMNSKGLAGLATREKGDREEDRGGKAPRLTSLLPSRRPAEITEDTEARGTGEPRVCSFSPLSRIRKQESRTRRVYTSTRAYRVSRLVSPLKSIARFLDFKMGIDQFLSIRLL